MGYSALSLNLARGYRYHKGSGGKRLSFFVKIAIGFVNWGAVAITDTLSRSCRGSDIEKTTSPDTNSLDIYTAFCAFCDHRLDHNPLFGSQSERALVWGWFVGSRTYQRGTFGAIDARSL